MTTFSHDELVKMARASEARLTMEQKELLVCLAEEASEVTKMVMKIFRFGYHSSHPSGQANADKLTSEVGDFVAIVERLTNLGLFSSDEIEDRAIEKLDKLEGYLLFKGDTSLA